MERLRRLLQNLPPAERRALVAHALPQRLRRALEEWMLAQPGDSHTAPREHGRANGGTAIRRSHADLSSESSSGATDSDGALSPGLSCRARLPLCNIGEESANASDGTSDDEPRDDMPPLAATSPTAASASAQPRAHCRGRVLTRGISSTSWSGTLYYNANVMLSKLHICASRTKDLAVALDHLVILTTLKQRVMQDMSRGESFRERVNRVFRDVCHEMVETAGADLGLAFSITLSKSYWMGRSGKLYTPCTPCLDVALATWERFDELERALPSKAVLGAPRDMLSRHAPDQIEANWRQFCSTYEDVCVAAGHSAWEARARLHAFEEATRSRRECFMERWNSSRMREEERCQRQALLQRRRKEAAEGRAMAREDRLGEWMAVADERVRSLVLRWGRVEERQRARQRRAEARRGAREARARRVAARCEARQRRAQREGRWRWMNRPGLTMADILGAQRRCPAGRGS